MKTLYKISVFGLLGAGLFVTAAFADVGSDNPTGTAGRFGPLITTGCGYTPYTANATRSVTDLTVAGGVGKYPLAFTRTLNSRYTAGLTADFGQAGNWLHSYSWNIAMPPVHSASPLALPSSYTVYYPDGGIVTFQKAPGNNDPDFRSPQLGVRDRFEPITIVGYFDNLNAEGFCYLRLPDGGRIKFWVYLTSYWTYNSKTRSHDYVTDYILPNPNFSFLYGIIDPYGQTTYITQATVRYGIASSMTVTEPAQRMLKIFYGTGPGNDRVIGRVEEWMSSTQKGRTVTYNYSVIGGTAYSALGRVDYPDGFSAWYGYQASDNTNGSSRLMIKWCVDPMFTGPMWAIGYTFVPSSSGAVYGQLQSENYCNPGTAAIGPAVSSLSVTGTSTRTETRGDGPSRTFTFGATIPSGATIPYLLANKSDFRGTSSPLPRTYDSSGFLSSLIDLRGTTTTFTNDPWTGNVLVTTYPRTHSDVVLNLPAATSQSGFTGSGSDPNNPYWAYNHTNAHRRLGRHRLSHKRGFSPTYARYPDNHLQTITYPDGGTETFKFNSFGQVIEHRLKANSPGAGGLETFTYDGRGLLTDYRDAYHLDPQVYPNGDPQNPSVPPNSTPSLHYTYYTSGPSMDRVQTITDARNNTTSFTYNARGQVLNTTLPGAAHPIINAYNPNGNGTLVSVTNELQKQTSYTYDAYKRVTSVTLPPPSGGPSPNPTTSSYDHTGGTASDYSHADANPTLVTLPSGKMIQTLYDNDLNKAQVTVGYNTSDAATSIFHHDPNNNLTYVQDPNGNITQNFYDAQNRLMFVDDPMVNGDPADNQAPPHKNSDGYTVSYIYDQANNVHTKLNPNNQLLTYFYDSMNRVKETWVPLTSNPPVTADTKYTYYPSGLLHQMEDPYLVKNDPNATFTYAYVYTYDLMGRKTNVAYPAADSNSAAKHESWTYDAAGNVHTFTNRAGSVQTFSPYDGRNRMMGFSWNDGATPSETIVYGDGLHLTQVSNSNATINNAYFDDDTLKSQEEWAAAENVHRTVNYTYDPDLNRETITYPDSHSFTYHYTNRNQADKIHDDTESNYPVTYLYDGDGNAYNETEDGAVTTTATFNPMNLPKHLSLGFVGTTTRTFDYGYDVMNDRNSIQQDGGTPEAEAYDLSEQSTTETINGTPTTFDYDVNGNRTGVNGGGTYSTNNLNQYKTFNGTAVSYDANGNLWTYNGWTYLYDAQNRMTSASNGSTSETFKYDGLSRQISHTLNAATTYNVWDGWNLIEEFAPGGSVPANVYVYGARGEIVERMSGGSTILYFQDGLGSTSHISDSSGHLLESYTYSRTGTPTFYNASGTPLNPNKSAHGVRHLFQGQLWTQETGLNDYRNRMEFPATGIFMQPDPVGFEGDPTNLYRFCGNNALNGVDPVGLFYFNAHQFFVGVGNTLLGYGGMRASFALGVAGVATAETYVGPGVVAAVAAVGFVDSGIRFQYGAGNTVAAFVDSPAARAALNEPSGLYSYVGQTLAGEQGQLIGDAVGAGMDIGTARTAFDAGMQVAAAAFELANNAVQTAAGGSDIANFGGLTPDQASTGGDITNFGGGTPAQNPSNDITNFGGLTPDQTPVNDITNFGGDPSITGGGGAGGCGQPGQPQCE